MNRRIKKRPSIVIQPLPDRTNDTLIHLREVSFWYNDIIDILLEYREETFKQVTCIYLTNKRVLESYEPHAHTLLEIDRQSDNLKSGVY